MNDMNLMLDLFALACGIYCLYAFLRLLVTKKLFPNGLLVPKEKKVSDCTDEQAFIACMMPPLATVAVVTTAYGVVMLFNDLLETPLLPYPWPLAMLPVVLAALVWYAVRNSRANRTWFGM